MSGRPHPESQRPLHGPLQSFNLDAEIAQLHQEEAWQQGQRNAITLRKDQGLNVVLLVMRSGDRLEEHSAPGPISLSVRDGRVRAANAVRYSRPTTCTGRGNTQLSASRPAGTARRRRRDPWRGRRSWYARGRRRWARRRPRTRGRPTRRRGRRAGEPWSPG